MNNPKPPRMAFSNDLDGTDYASSGIAEFTYSKQYLGGWKEESFVISLPSFQAAYDISKILEEVWEAGCDTGRHECEETVLRAIRYGETRT